MAPGRPAITMRRLLRMTDTLLLGVAMLLFTGCVGCAFLQVIYRYVLQMPLPWTEEVTVNLFIWSSFLAAAVITGADDHFSISYFVDKSPPRLRWALDVISTALCIVFAVLVVVKGTAWSWRMLPARTDILQISQGAVYAVIPLSMLYMLVHLTMRLATVLRRS